MQKDRENHLRLSDLTTKISQTINNSFNSSFFWVIADVTNHSYKTESTYHRFDLIEKDPKSNSIIAKLSGTAWASGSLKIAQFEKITGQKFTNNIHVLLNISVNFHARFGLQISINDIDSNYTLGVLEQQRQNTLQRLVDENTFIFEEGGNYKTRNNQLSHNKVLQKIALISSRNSASGEDFKHTLLQNAFSYVFTIDDYYTIVQGENNVQQFIDALINVIHSGVNYDSVVITRGGGAQTDFLLFDNYEIARAVAKFPIPIITGIGHQKNETIVDLMAHTSTKTPTKVAEFIIAHNRQFEQNIIYLQNNIAILSQRRCAEKIQQLSLTRNKIVNFVRQSLSQSNLELIHINQITVNTSKSILFNHKSILGFLATKVTQSPHLILCNRLNDIQNKITILKLHQKAYFKNKRNNLDYHLAILKIMSPENILKKGFAIIKVNNKITCDPNNILIGSDVEIILKNTVVTAFVNHKIKYNGDDFIL